MKRIPAALRMEVEKRAPLFLLEIERIIKERPSGHQNRVERESDMVHINLAAFRGDFALLYQCLWYAETKNVPVLFTATGVRRIR